MRHAKLRMLQQSRYAYPYYQAAFIPSDDWLGPARTTFNNEDLTMIRKLGTLIVFAGLISSLARGTERTEVLRQAKRRLLRQPRYAHPYYWAAFIPAGNWTPLYPHVLKQQQHGR